jgi:hypothetical protein
MGRVFHEHPGPSIHVVENEDEYWHLIEKYSGPRSFFDAQGELHGEIDIRLADAIDSVLIPLVGDWEMSEVWFHNTDFYGDGTRSLTFRHTDFPFSCVPKLRGLLTGEATEFNISIVLCDTLAASDNKTSGAIGITRDNIVVTRDVSDMFIAYFQQ